MKPPRQGIETKAHNLVEMSDAVLAEAIKNDFGLDLTIEEKIIGGYQSQVYKATLLGKTVFIRINKDPQKFEVEILGYGVLKEKGIPSPEVLAYKANPPTIGRPTMIISAAEGVNINKADLSIEQEDAVYENAGRILKTINEVRLEGFGPLETSSGKLKGQFKSYREHCESWGRNVNKAIDYLVASNLITA